MDLSDYGYNPSLKGKRRRRRLKKAIQDSNFDLVFDELKDFQSSVDGYRCERVRQDLLFLKNRKERYYTEKTEYVIKKESVEVAES